MTETRANGTMRYRLIEGDYCYDEIEAASPAEALEVAEANVTWGNYHTEESTIWVETGVEWTDAEGYEERERTWVQLDPPEPGCVDPEGHDWTAGQPWGSGGGVKYTDRCALCGLSVTVDTWAHNPATGEEGLRSVSYDPRGLS